MAMNGTFFSLATAAMARLTPVLEPPSTMVTPSRSANSRNFWRAEVGLVLVVEGLDLDRLAERLAAEIVDRHLDRLDRLGADHVGVDAGHVVDVADHDLVGRRLRRQARQRGEPGRGGRRQQ